MKSCKVFLGTFVLLLVGSVAQSLQAQSLGTVRTYFTTGTGSSNGALHHGHGLGYDTTSNTVWVTDGELGDDIFEFDATQPDLTTLAPLTRLSVPSYGTIEGLGYDDTDDTLWYIDIFGTVRHITKTGAPLGSFPTMGVFGLAVQHEFIWVDDWRQAYKYQKDGTFTGVTIPFVSGRDIGLAYDDDRDLIWIGHWDHGRFEAYDPTTGALVFQSPVLTLPNGNGRGHNLGYGAGKLWVATESLSADVIYSIEVNGFALRAGCEPPCEPVEDPDVRTQGFWKRVCVKTHPSGEHENLPGYVDCVNATATFTDVDNAYDLCDRLNPTPDRGKSSGKKSKGKPVGKKGEQAEAQFMALLLNVCSGRVETCNCVDDPVLGETTVGDVVVVIDALLSNPDRTFEDCVHAQAFADRINNGLTLVPCP